jgi:hypothetical protein
MPEALMVRLTYHDISYARYETSFFVRVVAQEASVATTVVWQRADYLGPGELPKYGP